MKLNRLNYLFHFIFVLLKVGWSLNIPTLPISGPKLMFKCISINNNNSK